MSTPPPAHPAPPERTFTSADGAWLFELFSTGRSDPWSRSETRAAYRLRVVRTADRAFVFDTRRHGGVAWVPTETRRELRLGHTPSDSSWVIIDIDAGTFWEENFREPISETRSVEHLREAEAG